MSANRNSYVTRASETDTIVSDWVTAKILAEPSNSAVSGMSAVSLFFAPGQGHARHNHPDNEQFIFVISGEGEMIVERDDGHPVTEPIRAGDLVSIPRGAYHSTFNTGWEPIRILAVYSPPGPDTTMRNSSEFEVVPPGPLIGTPGR